MGVTYEPLRVVLLLVAGLHDLNNFFARLIPKVGSRIAEPAAVFQARVDLYVDLSLNF